MSSSVFMAILLAILCWSGLIFWLVNLNSKRNQEFLRGELDKKDRLIQDLMNRVVSKDWQTYSILNQQNPSPPLSEIIDTDQYIGHDDSDELRMSGQEVAETVFLDEAFIFGARE